MEAYTFTSTYVWILGYFFFYVVPSATFNNSTYIMITYVFQWSNQCKSRYSLLCSNIRVYLTKYSGFFWHNLIWKAIDGKHSRPLFCRQIRWDVLNTHAVSAKDIYGWYYCFHLTVEFKESLLLRMLNSIGNLTSCRKQRSRNGRSNYQLFLISCSLCKKLIFDANVEYF